MKKLILGQIVLITLIILNFNIQNDSNKPNNNFLKLSGISTVSAETGTNGTCCYQFNAVCVTQNGNITDYYWKGEGKCS